LRTLRHWLGAAALVALIAAGSTASRLWAQDASAGPLLDVQHYKIDAKLNMDAQLLEATAEVHFVPRDPAGNAVFQLHNSLNVDYAEMADGTSLDPIRYRGDSAVHISFPETLPVDQPQVIRFRYGGRLIGYEESPAEGYSLAEITPERAILLYAGRWFPVNGYGADRFTSDIRVTVPQGLQVLGSGTGGRTEALDGVEHQFEFNYPSFPGTIAVVTEEPVRASAGNASSAVYMPGASEDLASEYGEAAAEMVEFYSDMFGAPYSKSLYIIEMGEYAPDGYWAPGLVLMSPYARREALNRQLLGKLVANQWWGTLVGAGNSNHLWLVDGTAQYSALLEVEESEGEEAFREALSSTRIEALTFDEVPLRESSRVGDFSPQMEALTSSRGAMVLHMLRWRVGDEPFFGVLQELINGHTWGTLTTDDFRAMFEDATGKDLDGFFLQWTESNITPEFQQEYTIYRLGGNEGFRVIGKINQDMDTFSMPVELKVETEGEPEFHVVEVAGEASDFQLETFGKPKEVILDPNHRILRLDDDTRVRVAIRRGEQLVELGYYQEALIEYQRALDINRFSSLAHYRTGEVFFLQSNFQSAANEFREALNGDRDPAWVEVWSHINLGKIFDITGQRERAVNEYQLAVRTRDDTQNAQNEASKYLANPYRRKRAKERTY
jgi:aminopeptidase N